MGIKEIWESLDKRAKSLVSFLLIVGILQLAIGVLMIWKSFASRL